VILSYLLEPTLSCFRKRYGLNTYRQLEWCTNDTLQLQRLANEQIGVGTWSAGLGTVPTTQPWENLASLNLSDPKHPTLQAPQGRGKPQTPPPIGPPECIPGVNCCTLDSPKVPDLELLQFQVLRKSSSSETQDSYWPDPCIPGMTCEVPLSDPRKPELGRTHVQAKHEF
jgi:hypothetical protein